MPAGSAMRIARTEDAGSGALPIGFVDVRGPELELALVTHPETGDQPLANTPGSWHPRSSRFLTTRRWTLKTLMAP